MGHPAPFLLSDITNILPLLRWKLEDWSFIPVARWVRAFIFFLTFVILRHVRQFQAIKALLRAHRELLIAHCYQPQKSEVLQRSLTGIILQEIVRTKHLSFNEIDLEVNNSQALRGIVLKAPHFVENQVLEKGVFLLKFNHSFKNFRHLIDMDLFLQHYTLILEPSWSGYANLDILYFTRFVEHPVIVQAAERRDYQFLEELGTNLIPINIGSGDWVNPNVFHPLDGEKKLYDAVMVAGWAPYKRHHVLFRTLRDLKDHPKMTSYRVALVGAPKPEGSREDVEKLIDIYGVRDYIVLFERLKPKEVNQVLNQSKVNLLLTLQEGSNRSLFEGFFAGVPGLALKNNIGVRKDYFTPQTGKLVAEKDLGSELLYFQEHWSEFDPRPWAEANIAPNKTVAKINEILKDLAYQRGEAWTRDSVAKSTDYSVLKYFPEDAGNGLPSVMEILAEYGRKK